MGLLQSLCGRGEARLRPRAQPAMYDTTGRPYKWNGREMSKIVGVLKSLSGVKWWWKREYLFLSVALFLSYACILSFLVWLIAVYAEECINYGGECIVGLVATTYFGSLLLILPCSMYLWSFNTKSYYLWLPLRVLTFVYFVYAACHTFIISIPDFNDLWSVMLFCYGLVFPVMAATMLIPKYWYIGGGEKRGFNSGNPRRRRIPASAASETKPILNARRSNVP